MPCLTRAHPCFSLQESNVARPQSHPNPVQLCFVEFKLDEANACLLRNGEAVALAPTPFTLLCALARQPGSLVTKDALLDAVWGHRFVSDSVLKTAISDLRKVLGDDPRQPRFIETVSRRGYRFIAAPSLRLRCRRHPLRCQRPKRIHYRHSLVAPTSFQDCSGHGNGLTAGNVQCSGLPENRGLARPR